MFSVKILAQSVKKIVLFEQFIGFFRHSLKYFYIIPNLVCAVVRVLLLSVSDITTDMVAGSSLKILEVFGVDILVYGECDSLKLKVWLFYVK